MKNGTAIISCTCKHEVQDALYGTGQRVANATAKQDDKNARADVRCTVCGKITQTSLKAVKS